MPKTYCANSPWCEEDVCKCEAWEDFKLHEEAGLQYIGSEMGGEEEWYGTQEKWSLYKKLKNEKNREIRN